MPAKPKFDPASAITNELIAILEKGVMPWRKPWRAGGSSCPLRHTGEAYQGVNNFLLTMRTALAGHASPYWMTMRQANEMDARIRKGEKSSIVVYYGQSYKDGDANGQTNEAADKTDGHAFRFMKSYRVFNADQIEGLDKTFHPEIDPEPQASTTAPEPIAHMEDFFAAIGADVVLTGREAKYMPPLDRIYMPEMSLFKSAQDFYAVQAHETAHWTKARHRLNRDYGGARFGDSGYSREEIVAELTSLQIGQHLGFTPHTIENSAAYIDHWLRVLKSDKRAIFALSGDAKRASDYLISLSQEGTRRDAA